METKMPKKKKNEKKRKKTKNLKNHLFWNHMPYEWNHILCEADFIEIFIILVFTDFVGVFFVFFFTENQLFSLVAMGT